MKNINTNFNDKRKNRQRNLLIILILVIAMLLLKEIVKEIFQVTNKYYDLFCFILTYLILIPFIIYISSEEFGKPDKIYRTAVAFLITLVYVFWYFVNFKEIIDKTITVNTGTTIAVHSFVYILFPTLFLSYFLYEAGKIVLKFIIKLINKQKEERK